MSFCARKPWLKSGQLDEEASSLIAYIPNFCSFSVPLTFFSVSITLSDGKLCRNQSLSFMFLAHLSSTCVPYNLKCRPTGRVSRYRSVDSKFDLCIIWMSFLSSASVDSAIWNYLSRSNFSHVVRWTSCELCSGLHEKSLFRTENGGDFFFFVRKTFSHCGGFWWLSVIWRCQTETFETRSDSRPSAPNHFCVLFDFWLPQQWDRTVWHWGVDVFDIIRTIVFQTPLYIRPDFPWCALWCSFQSLSFMLLRFRVNVL